MELDSNNLRPLSFAIYSKNHKMVDLIIELLLNKNKENILYEQGALHQATRMQDLKLMKKLLDYSIPIDSLDESGRTALSYSINNKKEPMRRQINIAVSKFLLDNGANPLYRNKIKNSFNSGTVLHSVCNAGDENLLELILIKLKQENKLSEINNASRNGLMTPLMLAAANDNIPIIQILLNNGANPDIRSFSGKISLDYCNDLNSFNLLSKYSELSAIELENHKLSHLNEVNLFDK